MNKGLKIFLIVLAVLTVIFIVWMVLIGIVFETIISDTLACALTFGLACKKDKDKDKKTNAQSS
jgi:hypothetical protein